MGIYKQRGLRVFWMLGSPSAAVLSSLKTDGLEWAVVVKAKSEEISDGGGGS